MKKNIFIIILVLLAIGILSKYLNPDSPEGRRFLRKIHLSDKNELRGGSNYTRPDRPKDVPVTDCNGDTIEWTWTFQRAYNEKKLFFHYDSTKGCVYLVVRKIN